MSNKPFDLEKLRNQAFQNRKDILQTIHCAGSGHPGGSLSAVELLLYMYEFQLRHDPKNPNLEDRDRLIVSKGHISPGVYVTLSAVGYFPKEELSTFRKFGSRLQGHVTVKTPGVEFNTGSLGHGLSVANGIALGAKKLNKSFKAYCLMGDGEIQEGSVWEAAMMASHFKLDNVCAIVDYNKVQENGRTNDIKNLEPLADKWKSFGWEVVEIDGHNFEELKEAFDAFGKVKGKPYAIISHTIKGKGVPFMEGNNNWHGKAPNDQQLSEALEQLAIV